MLPATSTPLIKHGWMRAVLLFLAFISVGLLADGSAACLN